VQVEVDHRAVETTRVNGLPGPVQRGEGAQNLCSSSIQCPPDVICYIIFVLDQEDGFAAEEKGLTSLHFFLSPYVGHQGRSERWAK